VEDGQSRAWGAGYSLMEQRLQGGGIVLLDGGTGTELEKRGAAMDPAAWCGPATLDNAEILKSIHLDYMSSGADVITTNTYASSRLMLEPAGYGERFEEINRAAVTAAHQAREMSGRSDVLVAGSLSHMCPMAADTDRPDADREAPVEIMREGFHELAMLLRDAGCDLILLEMMYCPRRTPLAFEAALATGLPVWAGFAARRDERGEVVSFARDESVPLADILSVLEGADVQAAGLMHTAADVVADAIVILRQHYPGQLMAYPDSGYFRMPSWQFEDIIEPEVLVGFARGWVDNGVQILGGCCGLSPDHIAALHQAFRSS
jgi:S-methylmethionine-dependent homocysteine/selenocysteine methylase